MKNELEYIIDVDAKTAGVRKAEKGLKDVDKAAGKAQKATVKYRDANNQMITSADRARIAIEKLAKADRKAAAEVAKYAKRRKASAAAIKTSAKAAAAGAAILAAAAIAAARKAFAATQAFAGFDDQIRKVGAVSGATAAQMKTMAAIAEKLGADTRYNSTQAAEGMQYLAMAGFNAEQTIAAIPNVLNLAAAGATELGDAADISTNILTGYGLKIKDLAGVNDVLVKAFTSSNTSLTDLGYAFSYVGPVAESSGAAFNETAALLGKLADAGYKGERGGTVLRGAYTRLQKGMAPVVEVLDELQVKSHDSNGTMRSMTEILRDLEAKGITAKQSLKLFGAEAGSGMMALINQGAGSIDALRAKLDEAGGTADRVATQMEGGIGGTLRSLSSAWDNLIKQFGKGSTEMGPGVKSLTETLKDPQVVKTMRDLGSAFGVVFSWISRIAAAWIKKMSWIYQLTQFFDDAPVKKYGATAEEAANKSKKIGDALTKANQTSLNQPIEALGATSQAVEKFEKDAQRAYQNAAKEAQKYAEQAIEWAHKISEANLTTEQKIAELQRQGLTEEEQRFSRQVEITDTLDKMKAAAAAKDYETAERLAKHAEQLYLKNIEGNKQVTAAQIAEYEKIRQSYVDTVLEPQKTGAEEQAQAAKNSADKIKKILADIKDKEIGVNFSQADLQKMQAEIAKLTKNETKTITIKSVQEKAAGGRVVRMAGGGRLSGGIPGVDSIDVRAMADEYFIKRPATQFWDRTQGRGFLDGINNPFSTAGQRIAAALNANMPRMNIAMPAIPKAAYADGGRTAAFPDFGTVNINLGGQSYPGLFKQDVARELETHIKRLQKVRPN